MQRIIGSRNITVGRDIRNGRDGGATPHHHDRSKHILKLQGVQITLLIVTLFLLVVNAIKYGNLDRQLDDIRQMTNRAAVVSGERIGQ